ncbi:hypothetical protein M422DRAFT_66302 [Sphaerobolus stellatus SS14]|nr:hypothetical protein M422DRAFT_66302 [Sphaerobolus stellatus SS14]
MTSVVLSIGKAVAMPLLKKFKDHVEGNKYGEASAAVAAIIAAQEASFDKLGNKVEKIVAQNELNKEFLKIKGWAKEMKTRLQKAAQGSLDPLHELHKALNDPSHGICNSLDFINALLIGNASKYSDKGTIELYLDELHGRLANEDNMDYTIPNYLSDLFEYLQTHFELQKMGLALRVLAADKYDDTVAWEKEMEQTLRDQINYAYKKLPMAIRKLKPDFETPAHAAHWWRFRETDGKREYFIRDTTLWMFTLGFDTDGDGPAPKSEWRFSHALDEPGLVSVQTRTDKSLWIIGEGYNSSGSGIPGTGAGYAGYFVKLGNRDEKRIKVKVVPVNDRNMARFKMVPEKGSRGEKPFHREWELCDDGVGQWE